MAKQPCEIIVKHILPSVRAQLSKELVDLGMSQQKTAELLDLTPAAVSQYVSEKRGYEIEFNDTIKKEIRKKAKEIIQEDKKQPLNKICKICDILKDENIIKQINQQYEDPERCSFCRFQDLCTTPQ
ncbi:MAG: putative transcriptional regulator [Candidatus Methanohalarchaeum thermophilum]|uniref:Transcriptional regulator n=1 Tax=Methanohalarchaeum thermophilum TaxID=1903181 RepID=A0A1Q6DSL0_METT1|nr:MAG: putative transcriptional regulator [Candidatus Methanohalarchaeum thermophilum]